MWMSAANTCFTLLHSTTLHTCRLSTSDGSSLSKYSLENNFPGLHLLTKKTRFKTYHGVQLPGRELEQDSVSCQYLFEILLEVFGLLINPRLSIPALACKAWVNQHYSLLFRSDWKMNSREPSTSAEIRLEMVRCQSN